MKGDSSVCSFARKLVCIMPGGNGWSKSTSPTRRKSLVTACPSFHPIFEFRLTLVWDVKNDEPQTLPALETQIEHDFIEAIAMRNSACVTANTRT